MQRYQHQISEGMLQKMLFRPSRTLSRVQEFRLSLPIPKTSTVKDNLMLIKSPFSSPFPRLCKSSLSQEACNASLVSVLQHPEYQEMKAKLEIEARGALDLACLHILVR